MDEYSNVEDVGRFSAACTVFESKIVVSGGTNGFDRLKSVEAYNHHKNIWTILPEMIEERYNNPGAVGMGNKMFVIGGTYELTCEVLDSVSKKFTSIMIEFPSKFDLKCRKRKRKFNDLKLGNNSATFKDGIVPPVSIGNKVIVIPKCSDKKYLTYDVLTGKWKLDENDFFSTDCIFSCSKVPLLR